jgi:hypothetical protein
MKISFHNCKFLPLDRSVWLMASSFIYFIVYSIPTKIVVDEGKKEEGKIHVMVIPLPLPGFMWAKF